MIQLPAHLQDVADTQYHLVMALDNPEVIKTAKEVAYYSAMLSAAIDDPLDDVEEQTKVETVFKTAMFTALDCYTEAVNKAL